MCRLCLGAHGARAPQGGCRAPLVQRRSCNLRLDELHQGLSLRAVCTRASSEHSILRGADARACSVYMYIFMPLLTLLVCFERVSHAQVFCNTPVESCREYNRARAAGNYSDACFDDLIGRLEVPSDRVKWDKPLFEVEVCVGEFCFELIPRRCVIYFQNSIIVSSCSSHLQEKEDAPVEAIYQVSLWTLISHYLACRPFDSPNV